LFVEQDGRVISIKAYVPQELNRLLVAERVRIVDERPKPRLVTSDGLVVSLTGKD
jgi:hypothetical protein